MSIFEAIMLICFGSAWPVSIYKSVKSGSNEGKSLAFLFIIFAGYLAGIVHKLVNGYDWVFWLYVFNLVMVIVDMMFFRRNSKKSVKGLAQ
jgi:hypothetical protein